MECMAENKDSFEAWVVNIANLKTLISEQLHIVKYLLSGWLKYSCI